MRIALLVLQDVWDTGLSVILDAFSLANAFSAQQMKGATRFEVRVVGVRKRVRSGHGRPVPVEPITRGLRPDWVIMPAIRAVTPERGHGI